MGEAVAAGVNGPRLRRLLAAGLWVRVVGDVVAPSSALPLPAAALAWAAWLASRGGVPSHLTAAAVIGLPLPQTNLLHVLVDPGRRVLVAGLVGHRCGLPAGQLGRPGPWGLPLPDAERVVLDSLRLLSVGDGRTLAFAAVQRRLVTVESLGARTALLAGSPGLRTVRARLAELGTGAHSVGEWRLHRVLLAAGIRGWVANQPVVVDGRVLLVPDIWFLDVPLLIEFDGRAYHEGERRWGADHERDLLCARLGFTVLRVTWDQVVNRPDEVVAAVRQTLALLRRAA